MTIGGCHNAVYYDIMTMGDCYNQITDNKGITIYIYKK
jgi:hypothetical protein